MMKMSIKYALFVVVMLGCLVANAQETLSKDSLQVKGTIITTEQPERIHELQSVVVSKEIPEKKEFVLVKWFNDVQKFFMDCDTNYVTPQMFNFQARTEVSYWHDYYRIRSSKTNNSMVIQSDPSMIFGGSLYYGIFGYGAVWNLNELGVKAGKNQKTSLRQTFTMHTAKFFAEYYTFNSGKTAQFRSVTGIDLEGKDRSFSGLASHCNGLNIVYLFNNKRFSWPAAFGENAVQRRSCGTWSLGFQYNHQKVMFDEDALPDYMVGKIDTTLIFDNIEYYDYSVSGGYSFNTVIGKNVLFAVSFMPSVGYRRSNITERFDIKKNLFNHDILNNLSTDFNFRMSAVWNNTRWFTALMLDTHTYSYRKEKFGLTNTYGTLKAIFGFNFWKKPEWRKGKKFTDSF